MIREATTDDIQHLVILGARMYAESERFQSLRFDAQRLTSTIANVIDSPHGFARVMESGGEVVGGLLAVLTPHWFSPDLTACDLALFIAPEHRGTMAPVRLLNAYAAWAHESGAKQILLGIMTGLHVEQTEALCERLGWRRAGVVMEI
jgi:GNAT superfamily N-acetyltransferase